MKKADFNYNFNFSGIESVTDKSIFSQMENLQKIASTIKPNFEIIKPKIEPINLGLNNPPKIQPNITLSALKMVRNTRINMQSHIMPSVLETVRNARIDIQSYIMPSVLETVRNARIDIQSYIMPSVLETMRNARIDIQSYIMPSVLETMRNARIDMQSYITPDILNMLSTLSELDINELQSYWEDEEVQEIIDGELFAADQENDQLSIMQQLNNWAIKVLDYPSSLKERSPFIFLVLTIIMTLSSLIVIPAVQDIIKEKVWHLSDYLEEKKEEPIRKQTKTFKTRVIKDDEVASEISYSDAVRSMGYVRITNRKTDVFRSGQRKSGKIDTIQSNKPVIMLHKKKNWSLVMYQGDNNQEIEGWVFTKNLIK
ncbi:hypothetical protein [Priestia megaterium]|uniref:hypothetical protein n=1 Tax=Priestia megaterium TaxID=1404 RepID=UPI0009909427|nr:hypothetical protein [Priestia megaterium]AQU77055.1 hypothetical protein BUW91_28005 [Priestia megaterium]